jgi:phosphatidate cytidylyltransferase
MLLRVLTAAVLIPAVVALVWWGPAPLLAAVAAAVAILALREFFNLGEIVGLRAYRYWTFACAAGIFGAQYVVGSADTLTLGSGVTIVRPSSSGLAISLDEVLLVFVFGLVIAGLATRRPLLDVLSAVSISSAGLLLIALPFSYLVRVDEIVPGGRDLVLFTLFLIWAGDMLAYFTGRSFGRIPFAPILSPKKTWEGAIANFVASLLVAVAFARWMQLDVVALTVVAALANVAGQMGDLIKSAYKRAASVKDSGTLLPGHGGMLDRIDSLILASPVVWLAWRWLAPK